MTRILLLAGFAALAGPAFARGPWTDPPAAPPVLEAPPLPAEPEETGTVSPWREERPVLAQPIELPLRPGCTVSSYVVGEGAVVRVHRC
ncbi:hypothetical protein [Microvirga massiliensis]|uniref:hypothetical protein n=1 Tax=Microvirga massiliensis TaxID=1033741 RepID=UPI00062B4A04|nr:hypothetical protein [Microvirga massiliensis]